MATTLDVVNDCLATLGEAPLNTLNEPHEYKGKAQRLLDRLNKELQAPGWWFNLETISLTPAPITGHIQLAGDVIKFQSSVRAVDTYVRQMAKPWLVQRGSRLYDTRTRSFAITEDVVGEQVRLVPFQDLPIVVNEYIAAATVLRFQSDIDGDNSRRQELTQRYTMARSEARAENIRQLAINFRDNNVTLQRLKAPVRSARRYIGR